VQSLAAAGEMEILVCDPWVKALPPMLAACPAVRLVDAETARDAADIAAFLVAHRQFRRLDRSLFLNKVVVDVVGLMSRD
jgi:UDP-N-acetyl-D-mannosaminuronic acid dehydrogenase